MEEYREKVNTMDTWSEQGKDKIRPVWPSGWAI